MGLDPLKTIPNVGAGIDSSKSNAVAKPQPQSNPKRNSKRGADFESDQNSNGTMGLQPPTAPAAMLSSKRPRNVPNSTASTYQRCALTNARNINNANVPQSHYSQMGSQATYYPMATTAASTQLAQMSVQTPTIPYQDPSLAPSPSVVSMNWRNQSAASSQTSNRSGRGFSNGRYKQPKLKKEDFRKGDVIAMPFHTANLDPYVNPTNDRRCVLTVEGPAYSKRRMMVIMWKFDKHMFCVPLFSFNGLGLSGKPNLDPDEYVCVKNVGDESFVKQGRHEPVEVQVTNGKGPMTPSTTIWITGGMKVSYDEQISYVGRIAKDGYQDLFAHWVRLNTKAQKEAWVD